MRKLANVVLSGSLDYISLGELIQLLGNNGSTGVMRISSKYAKEPGWIYFRRGNPVDAENGGMIGLEAANSLFGWLEGQFEFSREPVDLPNRIQRTRMELVLNGCRMLDDGTIGAVGPVSYETPPADAAAVLDRIPLVKGPQVDYSYLVDEEEYAEGDEILLEGMHGGWIWVILEGRVGIVKETARGGKVKLLTLGEGSFLGSIDALAGRNIRSATSVAERRVSLGVIDIQRLTGDFARMSPPFRQVLFCLDKRLKETSRTVVDIHAGRRPPGRRELKGCRRLIAQGAHHPGLFSIGKGDALVVRQHEGRQLALARLSRGDVIGTPPFFDMGQEPGCAGIYASREIETISLDRNALQQEYEAASMTVRNISDNLAACVAATSILAWELDTRKSGHSPV